MFSLRGTSHATINGAQRRFCCAGCLGIAQTIHAAGLAGFYTQRAPPVDSQTNSTIPDDDASLSAAAADAAGLVLKLDDDVRETSLLLEGVRCSACISLMESYLRRLPGLLDVTVNFATRRARLRWNERQVTLTHLLQAITAIGYRGYPYDPGRREALARREARSLLSRTAIAWLAMMQVMMIAVPGYISTDGTDREYRTLLDWASLALTLPVLLFSAQTFFFGALRDVRMRRLGMDVPVALGIGGAFLASAWATMTGVGAVYYDSVTMFVALLLLARLFELHGRQRAAEAVESLTHDLPEMADRLIEYPGSMAGRIVSAGALDIGDHVRVAVGGPIPADGEVIEGHSSVEEALLTGESRPQRKKPGDRVLAGSINCESPLIMRVSAAGGATRLASLGRLVEQASNERPRIARFADRVASQFVVVLLLLAAITGIVWWQLEPSQALSVVLAILVVSCPCALSLATPAALAAAAGALSRRRILVVRSHSLETLSQVTHVVFDKTGTLTTGRVQLLEVQPLAQLDRPTCLAIAAALERGSEHSIARALCSHAQPGIDARNVVAVPGKGVEGEIDGRRYRLGRSDWVGLLHQRAVPAMDAGAARATVVTLGDESGWVGQFCFDDSLRPGAREAVLTLQRMGITASLLSGDRLTTVREVAQAVGITQFYAGASPEEKCGHIAALQRNGAIVAMVGDGVNDAPALALANVSLSLGSAAALTQWTADVVVLGDDPTRVAEAIRRARQAFRVIRQNLAWAFIYNVVAIGLAATGHLTPLAAAVGMSGSSLLVLANALRLLRTESAAVAAGSSASTSSPVVASS